MFPLRCSLSLFSLKPIQSCLTASSFVALISSSKSSCWKITFVSDESSLKMWTLFKLFLLTSPVEQIPKLFSNVSEILNCGLNSCSLMYSLGITIKLSLFRVHLSTPISPLSVISSMQITLFSNTLIFGLYTAAFLKPMFLLSAISVNFTKGQFWPTSPKAKF